MFQKLLSVQLDRYDPESVIAIVKKFVHDSDSRMNIAYSQTSVGTRKQSLTPAQLSNGTFTDKGKNHFKGKSKTNRNKIVLK